jgi:hypothetical protein
VNAFFKIHPDASSFTRVYHGKGEKRKLNCGERKSTQKKPVQTTGRKRQDQKIGSRMNTEKHGINFTPLKTFDHRQGGCEKWDFGV